MKKVITFKHLFLFASTIANFAFSAYITSIIVQAMFKFNDWMYSGRWASLDVMSFFNSLSLKPINSIGYATSNKISSLVMLGLFLILLISVELKILRVYSTYSKRGILDKDRNIRFSEDGVYGTANWAYIDDLREKNLIEVKNPRKTQGYILAQKDTSGDNLISIKPKAHINNHIAVYGASGSGKSRKFVRNYIIQAVKKRESLIITDPKGEMFESTSQYLKDNGYIVKIFNLVNPEHSNSWNCLKEIRGDELRAQIFADTIIKNTSGKEGDPFWDKNEMNLLKALAMRVNLGRDFEAIGEQNMGTAYDLLTKAQDVASLDRLFDKTRLAPLPDGSPAPELKALNPYDIFKQTGENIRGNIITGLGTRLQVFQNQIIKKITQLDDIDLTLPGKKPCAYFCVMSDQHSALNFLSSLFFSFLFIDLVEYADNNGGQCDVPVNFLLDEFPNIGAIADFEKKISTVRSRGLNIAVIFQAISQLKNRYPFDVWQEILGNCDTQLFLGCNDHDTAKYISERSGMVTIKANSLIQERSSKINPIYRKGIRESYGEGKSALLTPDEVLRMDNEKCLVIFRSNNALSAYKYDYSLHPESRKFKSFPINKVKNIRTVNKEEIAEQRILDFENLTDEDSLNKIKEAKLILGIKGEIIETKEDEIEIIEIEDIGQLEINKEETIEELILNIEEIEEIQKYLKESDNINNNIFEKKDVKKVEKLNNIYDEMIIEKFSPNKKIKKSITKDGTLLSKK